MIKSDNDCDRSQGLSSFVFRSFFAGFKVLLALGLWVKNIILFELSTIEYSVNWNYPRPYILKSFFFYC